jgi:signal transduction histidine kinase
MKNIKVILGTLKKVQTLLLLALVAYVATFSYFRWSHRQETYRLVRTIESLLRNDSLVANSYALSKSVADLETLGFIRCVVILENQDDQRAFYNTSSNQNCQNNMYIKTLVETEISLKAVNGLLYLVRFRLPISWQSILLELMTYLLIAASVFIYRRHEREQNIKNVMAEALINQSRQVAHDIRSPLSALNMVAGQLTGISEDKRLLIRGSVARINDIANELLTKGKQIQGQTNSSLTSQNAINQAQLSSQLLSSQLLSPLIDALVSEKRIQFREKQDVEIEADINQGYGLFSNINGTELKRVLSNLLSNAIESFPEGKGRVVVAIRGYSDLVSIIVQDNGKGIPPHILEKLGQMGVTHGKEGTQSGSGIGVYHAKKTIESFGGKFQISSKEGMGTSITMSFPRARSPKWFVEKLLIKHNMEIISLDDDFSVHQIWKGRFQSQKLEDVGVRHLTFTSGSEFITWLTSQKQNTNTSKSSRLYLVDYELLNQNATGLDIIEELEIGAQSILVTSRYEEDKIRERCEKLGVRLIPKAMAGFVPIEVEKSKELYDAILIDDDEILNRPIITQNSSPAITTNVKTRYDLCLIDDDKSLVQSIWEMVAKTKGHNIKMFATPEEFQTAADSIDRETPIFIDVSLGNGVSGIDFSDVVHKMGFLNINLATGYSADSIKAPSFIGRIIGKDYPEDVR